MKKLITILFLLLSVYSIGQIVPFPNRQPLGSPATLTVIEGAASFRWGSIITRYTDTTSANINTFFKTYPGAVIIVGDTVFVRDRLNKRWLSQWPGSVSGGVLDTFAVEYPIIVRYDVISDGVKRDTLAFSGTYTDSLITAAGGGGGGSPGGNYGNVQINRNSAFATPATDTLIYTTAGGFVVKNKAALTGKLTVNSGGKTLVLGGISAQEATYAGLCFGCVTPDFTNYFIAGDENTTYIRGGTNFQYTIGSTNRAVMNSVGLSLDPNQFGTAALYLPIGTTAASTAPLKFKLTSAAKLTTPEAGAFEAVSDRLMYTGSSVNRDTIAYLADLRSDIALHTWQKVMDAGATTTTSGVLNDAKFTFNPTSVQELLRITPITSFSGAANWSVTMDESDNGDGTFNYPIYMGFRDASKRGIWSSYEPHYVPSPGVIKLEAHPIVVRNGNDFVDIRGLSYEYQEEATAATSSALTYFRTSTFGIRTLAVDNDFFSVEPVNGIKLYNTATSTTDYLALKYSGGSYGSSYAEIGFNTTGTGHQHAGIHLDTRTAVAPIRFFVAASGTASFDAMDIFQDGSVQIGSLNTQIASTRFYVKGLGATSGTYAAKFQNSSGTDLFGVRNDGAIAIAGSVGSSGQVLTSNGSAAASWTTISGSGVTTMAAIGSSPNANGASISGSTLTLQPADGSFGGVVTTGTQTFAGGKSFTGAVTVGSLASGAIASTSTISADGDITSVANMSAANLLWNTYTPTITNGANVDASTAYACQYFRVGNTVTISGKIDIDPTSTATSTDLTISLPIASDFGNDYEAGGVGFCGRVAGLGFALYAEPTANELKIEFVSANTIDRGYFFTVTYQIL